MVLKDEKFANPAVEGPRDVGVEGGVDGLDRGGQVDARVVCGGVVVKGVPVPSGEKAQDLVVPELEV